MLGALSLSCAPLSVTNPSGAAPRPFLSFTDASNANAANADGDAAAAEIRAGLAALVTATSDWTLVKRFSCTYCFRSDLSPLSLYSHLSNTKPFCDT